MSFFLRSDKKKSSNWLKRLTPGRKTLKMDGTPEERAPIYESSPEESPESKEAHLPRKQMKTIRINPSPIETPVIAIDLIGQGPHTSTPKFAQEKARVYKSLPRGSTRPTPHRPCDGRLSVRRRLPYNETLGRDKSLCHVNTQYENEVRVSPPMNLDISPLEKRANSHRRIIESPKFQNRLHPSDSTSDIPYVDSCDDILYDDSAKSKVSRDILVHFSENVCFDERPKAKDSRGISADHSANVSFDEQPKVLVSRGSQADLSDDPFDEGPKKKVSRGSQSDILEDISFDERPKTKIRERAENVSFDEPPRRKITRSNTIIGRDVRRDRCFSEPIDENTTLDILPERSYSQQSIDGKSTSSSERSLKVKRTMSCREVQKTDSPMEEDENRSLNWHAKMLKSPDDSTVTFSPYK